MPANARTLAAARALAPLIQTWRRHLHAHPELSGEEQATAEFIANELRRAGLPPRTGIGGTHGVVADILPEQRGARERPAVMLRADMDALPITELSDLPYKSTRPGVMHACGHDAHVAMLLGAATLLQNARGELRQPVRLVFQPAEELAPGGAAALVAAGVLEGVERAFGLHIWSEMPVGAVGTRVGPFMSSTCELRIALHGRGGHAAMPQQCVDPIVLAAHVITGLQTVVSRNLAMTDSGVLSITQVHGGAACNVIPERVELGGTLRAVSESVRATLEARLRQIVDATAAAFGGTAEIDVRPGYPALVNDAGAVEAALSAARAIGVAADLLLTLPVQGGGEDFAYYAQRVPAAFLFLGARNEALDCRYPHHHPRFNIDEAALPLGVALLAEIALASS